TAGATWTAGSALPRLPGAVRGNRPSVAAAAALAAAGVEVRRESRVTALSRAGGPGLQVEDANGRQETFELLVLAVPASSALRLLKGLGGDRPELVAAAALPSSPIVNVHLFTDRPFLPGPVVVVPRSPLQWVFDRSALDQDPEHDSWHSAVSLSAADREVGVPERELATTMWELCRTTFPAAARAKLRHVRVTREAHATFAALPGSVGARPGPRSAVPGVALAGSWTDTGWPATMEGAVRSGRRAAATLTE
ncbi:MAG: FAD-dependent oxidoreductase, partial [Candidatus Dormiibacterota bacterium]